MESESNDVQSLFNIPAKDVALKAIIFSMLFYLVNSEIVRRFIQESPLLRLMETNFVQALIFAIFYYIIAMQF